MLQFVTAELWPTALHALDALDKWPGARDPTQTAAALRAGSEQLSFARLARDPVMMRRFAGMMRCDAAMLVQGPDALEQSPLWAEVDGRGGTFVDVGGGQGHVSVQLARGTARMRFVVQDRPEVVEGGEAALPERWRRRVAFQPHDFFEEQPVKGADVYFLRKILHDWPDQAGIKILRNLVPALEPGAKVVVCENILPETARPAYEEKEARCVDAVDAIYAKETDR